jgi:tetrahydromethanopterin S-methyltransferase subunit F
MSLTKRTVLEVGVGLAVGFVLACVFGPSLLSTIYKPLSQDAFSCAGSVEQALAYFVKLELGMAAVGGIGLAVGLRFLRRLFRRKDAATA